MRAQFVEEIERGSRLLATSLIRKEAKKIKQFHTESDLSEFSVPSSDLVPSSQSSPATSKVSFNSPSSSPSRPSRVPPPSPKPHLSAHQHSSSTPNFRSTDSLPIQPLSFSPQIPNSKPVCSFFFPFPFSFLPSIFPPSPSFSPPSFPFPFTYIPTSLPLPFFLPLSLTTTFYARNYFLLLCDSGVQRSLPILDLFYFLLLHLPSFASQSPPPLFILGW